MKYEIQRTPDIVRVERKFEEGETYRSVLMWDYEQHGKITPDKVESLVPNSTYIEHYSKHMMSPTDLSNISRTYVVVERTFGSLDHQ